MGTSVVAERTIGLVLAAGAGSRFGMPKALARTPDGAPWLRLTTSALVDGGCDEVVVVLGAMAETALHLVPADANVVIARAWERGQSASLLAGLAACRSSAAGAVVVTLVDLPGLTSAAAHRVIGEPGAGDLRRAIYDGVPGHPVLIGRQHWDPLAADLSGDTGATRYLMAHQAESIDCTDLGGGVDVDTWGAA